MDDKLVMKKLLEHDKQFSVVAKKLLEHDDRFDSLEAKIDKNHNQVLNRLDSLVTGLDRLDQERLFSIHRLDRHEKDIKKIKTKIGLTD